MSEPEIWHSYQCNSQTHKNAAGEWGCGLCFTVRVDADMTHTMETAKCPVCGEVCGLLERSEADKDGLDNKLSRTNELLKAQVAASEKIVTVLQRLVEHTLDRAAHKQAVNAKLEAAWAESGLPTEEKP